MSQAVATPPAPAPATAAPAAPRVSNPNAAGSLVRAFASAPKGAPPKPVEEEAPPPEPRYNPVELAIFLRQTVLVICAMAAVSCAGAARYGNRSWLMAVMCAAVAAIVSGVIGMALARSFAEHCLTEDTPVK